MDQAKTYTGGCHCGRVSYRATANLTQVLDCNCSICEKRGTLWAFVKAAQFELLKGADALTDYQFGKKHIHHLFCSRCGVKSFARGTNREGKTVVAVNVRCLEDVDLDTLQVNRFNGRAL